MFSENKLMFLQIQTDIKYILYFIFFYLFCLTAHFYSVILFSLCVVVFSVYGRVKSTNVMTILWLTKFDGLIYMEQNEHKHCL